MTVFYKATALLKANWSLAVSRLSNMEGRCMHEIQRGPDDWSETLDARGDKQLFPKPPSSPPSAKSWHKPPLFVEQHLSLTKRHPKPSNFVVDKTTLRAPRYLAYTAGNGRLFLLASLTTRCQR